MTDSIPNFRQVGRMNSLYRSSNPDAVADLLHQDSDRLNVNALSDAEKAVLHEITLWIDMRFPKEINSEKISRIVQHAPGGPFEMLTFQDPRGLKDALLTAGSGKNRVYLYSEDAPFTMDSMIQYASQNWITSEVFAAAETKQQQHDLVMGVIIQRGLAGLFEMLLERRICVLQILQAVTLHLEEWGSTCDDDQKKKPPKVLLHCTLGKDRTGVIAMLFQSMVGDSDDDIMEEFAKSQCVQDLAHVKLKAHFGDVVDSSNLPRADAETMKETLNNVREKYGSVDGYLDSIGFDASWRRRFVAVVA